jgi:hypothetical protein
LRKKRREKNGEKRAEKSLKGEKEETNCLGEKPIV